MSKYILYTVWACLKAVTPNNALKEITTNKYHSDYNYSAPFACRSFAFVFYLPGGVGVENVSHDHTTRSSIW